MPHQMVTNSSRDHSPSHYQVLGLPWNVGPSSDLSVQQLKAAYRRALFLNHPDKTGTRSDSKHDLKLRQISGKEDRYTIDQIIEAYTTLSIPKSRSEYDRALSRSLLPRKSLEQEDNYKSRSGLEAIDLDDLDYDTAGKSWFKSCRCGDERGYEIVEADLEEASDLCELHVGCRGCSLWLKVLFGIAEEKAEHQSTDIV